VLDIRRQNMLEHLTYKALFEMSTDRADFLSRLFSRQRLPDRDKDSIFPIEHLIAAFNAGIIHTYYDILELPN
jgi:hypothetical protein